MTDKTITDEQKFNICQTVYAIEDSRMIAFKSNVPDLFKEFVETAVDDDHIAKLFSRENIIEITVDLHRFLEALKMFRETDTDAVTIGFQPSEGGGGILRLDASVYCCWGTRDTCKACESDERHVSMLMSGQVEVDESW